MLLCDKGGYENRKCWSFDSCHPLLCCCHELFVHLLRSDFAASTFNFILLSLYRLVRWDVVLLHSRRTRSVKFFDKFRSNKSRPLSHFGQLILAPSPWRTGQALQQMHGAISIAARPKFESAINIKEALNFDHHRIPPLGIRISLCSLRNQSKQSRCLQS